MGSLPLRKLSLTEVGLGGRLGVKPELLALAVSRIPEVSLRDCCLSPDHITQILHKVVMMKETTLRRLHIPTTLAWDDNHHFIPPELITAATNKLERLSVFSQVSTEPWTSPVFEPIWWNDRWIQMKKA